MEELSSYLGERYGGEAILTKNGRSALALALKAYFHKGDKIIVNGFTCYAVVEAVKAAGLVPVFADIEEETLNFSARTLEKVVNESCTGLIIQNTLGNPVDIREIERFAGKHGLMIIEDLAHSAGVVYADGREAGTVGMATAFSFGKDKAVDTVSGGALVLRYPCKNRIKAPTEIPQFSDRIRARFYPMWGSLCRRLTRVHLGGVLMRFLIRTRLVERSADNKLDLSRTLAPFEAKLALEQFRKLGKGPLRDFALVQNRGEVLKELRAAGYYFDGFWYEKPVSPERYYASVGFPEEACPTAVKVSQTIINLPRYYKSSDLAGARKIIRKYTLGGANPSADESSANRGRNTAKGEAAMARKEAK